MCLVPSGCVIIFVFKDLKNRYTVLALRALQTQYFSVLVKNALLFADESFVHLKVRRNSGKGSRCFVLIVFFPKDVQRRKGETPHCLVTTHPFFNTSVNGA